MAYVSRDPFARQELHREQMEKSLFTCDWCGGVNGFGKLFQYRIESDGGRKTRISGKFCSRSCMQSYHS